MSERARTKTLAASETTPVRDPGRRLVVARPILIVDDDRRSRLLTTACLTSLGLSNPTVELSDGDQAMEALEAVAASGVVPVLVLLDLSLPGKSGEELLAWMRETPGLEQVPVIVLTSDDDASTVTALYRLAVHSYLVKPVGFEALGAVVRALDLPWMLT